MIRTGTIPAQLVSPVFRGRLIPGLLSIQGAAIVIALAQLRGLFIAGSVSA